MLHTFLSHDQLRHGYSPNQYKTGTVLLIQPCWSSSILNLLNAELMPMLPVERVICVWFPYMASPYFHLSPFGPLQNGKAAIFHAWTKPDTWKQKAHPQARGCRWPCGSAHPAHQPQPRTGFWRAHMYWHKLVSQHIALMDNCTAQEIGNQCFIFPVSLQQHLVKHHLPADSLHPQTHANVPRTVFALLPFKIH